MATVKLFTMAVILALDSKKVWMDGVMASTSGDFEWEGVLQSTGDILGVGSEVESEV
jgi:hypothetical protein